MAKKKSMEGSETLAEQTNMPEPENSQINTEDDATVEKETMVVENEPESDLKNSDGASTTDSFEKEETSAETVVASQEDIPLFALNYLKRHTEIKMTYIDKLGGVFPPDTPKTFFKDATLYQNPFYKQ